MQNKVKVFGFEKIEHIQNKFSNPIFSKLIFKRKQWIKFLSNREISFKFETFSNLIIEKAKNFRNIYNLFFHVFFNKRITIYVSISRFIKFQLKNIISNQLDIYIYIFIHIVNKRKYYLQLLKNEECQKNKLQ